jgi:hypothetical protein
VLGGRRAQQTVGAGFRGQPWAMAKGAFKCSLSRLAPHSGTPLPHAMGRWTCIGARGGGNSSLGLTPRTPRTPGTRPFAFSNRFCGSHDLGECSSASLPRPPPPFLLPSHPRPPHLSPARPQGCAEPPPDVARPWASHAPHWHPLAACPASCKQPSGEPRCCVVSTHLPSP